MMYLFELFDRPHNEQKHETQNTDTQIEGTANEDAGKLIMEIFNARPMTPEEIAKYIKPDEGDEAPF